MLFEIEFAPAALVHSILFVKVKALPRISNPPLVPSNRIWLKVKTHEVVRVHQIGFGTLENDGVAITRRARAPQLALLFQLAFAPPPPVQLKVAARLSTTLGSQPNTNIAVTASRLANRGDREEWGVNILVIFIFSVLKLGTTSHFTQESDQMQDRIITRISCPTVHRTRTRPLRWCAETGARTQRPPQPNLQPDPGGD